jgi:Kef-type K+ transport system membrane component KefB
MPSFGDLLIVVTVAFAAPLTLGLAPRVRLPSVVLEIVAGIIIGPSVLGIVEVDQSIEVVALIGLAFVLFLAGLEIEFEKLRGPVLRLTALAFAISFAIAVLVGLALNAGGLVETPLLVAIILCATSLGVIVPVLKDAGEISSTFGQLIVAAASIADFGAIILLSLFFSGEGGVGSTLLLLGGLALLSVVVFLAVLSAEHSMRIRAGLLRLQDTTAQIRVRAAIVLFIGFAAVAEELGLEVILGTFIAGAIISLVDRDEVMTHPDFRRKLEAIGFGFFIPVFFVASGVRFDGEALFADTSNLVMVPIFLAALLVVRGLPAIIYRRVVDGRRAVVAGVLQATSLPFIVAATAIGMELGLIDAAESAALIGAGLLSVLIFPITGLALLRGGEAAAKPPPKPDEEPAPLMAM